MRLRVRAMDMVVGQLAGACVLLGLIEVALLLSGPPTAPRWALLLWPMAAGIYLAAGVLAWLRRPSNRMGALMILGAMIWLVAGLANVIVAPALVAAGLVAATLTVSIVVHLVLAFPSGVLRGRASVVAVAGGYFANTVLQAPQYLFGPPNPLRVAQRPDLATTGLHLQWAVGACVMILTAVILLGRWRRARGGRRVLAPLFSYGIFAALFVPVSAQLAPSLFPNQEIALAVAQVIVLTGVPVAFVLVMLRGGFGKTAQLEELGAWLGAHPPARSALESALAEALGDDSVRLAFWVSEGGGYFDHEGRPVALPVIGSDRAVVEVSLGERHVGAICYDGSLIHDPGIVIRAGRIIAMALDNDRLLVELRASRELVRASRARIVEACDRERRQVARDLHDGLQARLVLLAIKAHAIRTDPSPGLAMRREGCSLEADLQTAITELRELVHGVMPAALTEGGLYAAAEELTDRIPIPTEVRFSDDGARPPTHVESTCYFVVAEALSNAVKHSRATELQLTLEHADGLLRLEVRDDGVGGVCAGGGVGLRGMADRIEALDGHLSIDSPPGRGTRIVVEVPCAS